MKTVGHGGGKLWLWLVVLIVMLGAYGYWAAQRPLPDLSPVAVEQFELRTPVSKLTWPGNEQAAVGIIGSRILDTHGAQTPLPTASTAKLITALAVLHQKPLNLGEQGPTITLGANDVALYNSYKGQAGSVIPVTAGERVSEYQMLEAMMLPSANNMADSLAIWAFGSLPAYTSFANSYLQQLGLAGTHVGSDASGFAPSTTSTARDLVILGQLAMQDPVLAQIVGLSSVDGFPVANTIKNVNFLLGTDNIIGVKTGNTDMAGGVFVGAARAIVNNQPVTIVTTVIGAPNLWQAMHDSLSLIQSATQANFSPVTAASGGSVVGHYQQPWGGTLTAVAARTLTVRAWNGSTVTAWISLQPVSPTARTGQTVGSVIIPKSALAEQQSIPVKLGTGPTRPSLWWRLTHPFWF